MSTSPTPPSFGVGIGSTPFSISLGPIEPDTTPIPALPQTTPDTPTIFMGTAGSDAILANGITMLKAGDGSAIPISGASVNDVQEISTLGENYGVSGAAVAAIVVGSLFIVALLAALLVYRERRPKHRVENGMTPWDLEKGETNVEVQDPLSMEDAASLVSYNGASSFAPPTRGGFLAPVGTSTPKVQRSVQQRPPMIPITVVDPSRRDTPQGLVLFPSPPTNPATVETSFSHSRIPSLVLTPAVTSPNTSTISSFKPQKRRPSCVALEASPLSDSEASVADVRAALDQAFYSRPRTRSTTLEDVEMPVYPAPKTTDRVTKARLRAATLPTIVTGATGFLPPAFKCPSSPPPPVPQSAVTPKSAMSCWSALELSIEQNMAATPETGSGSLSDDDMSDAEAFIPMPSPLAVRQKSANANRIVHTESLIWTDDQDDMLAPMAAAMATPMSPNHYSGNFEGIDPVPSPALDTIQEESLCTDMA